MKDSISISQPSTLWNLNFSRSSRIYWMPFMPRNCSRLYLKTWRSWFKEAWYPWLIFTNTKGSLHILKSDARCSRCSKISCATQKQTRFWMWTRLHVACDDWNEVSNLHKNPSTGWLSKHIQDSKISSYTNQQIISDPKICSELIGHFGPSLKKDHFTRIQASSSKCTSTTQIQPSHTDFTMVAFQLT